VAPTYRPAEHLASLLRPVRNSEDFIYIMGTLWINQNDTVISFYTALLFWKISVLWYPPWHTQLKPCATRRTEFHHTFKWNDHNERQIPHACNPPEKEDTPREDLISVAFLSFVGPHFNCIGWVISNHNIKSCRKVNSSLQPVKDNLGLNVPGACNIPWKCEEVYSWQTGCSTDTRIKEHHWHTWQNLPWLSTV